MCRVNLENLDRQVLPDHQDQKARPDKTEDKEFQVYWVLLAKKENLDLLDHQDHPESTDWSDLK